jgi:hypothetical protein
MKTSIHFLVIILAVTVFPRPSIGAPATSAPVQTAAVSNSAPQLPVSTFVVPTNKDQGLHDPFFPNSNRLWANAPGPATNNTPAVGALPPLVLTALSGGGSVPWIASINGNPFKEGEEGEVVTPSGRIKIRCVKITEKSVSVEIGGQLVELQRRQSH